MGSAVSTSVNVFYKALGDLWGYEHWKIIMLGLDAAGKTTLLYQLKLGRVVETIPTIGINIETIQYRNVQLDTWDFSGHPGLRKLYHDYYASADAVTFVIDSTDSDRLQEAREEILWAFRNEAMRLKPLLVLANKQDHPDAMTPELVRQKLQLEAEIHNVYHVQGTTALTGDGVYDGLAWLHSQIQRQRSKEVSWFSFY